VAALPFPIDLATWRSLFPEFATAPDILVQSRIDQAALRIEPLVWGERSGEGQAFLTAHLLTLAPGGQFARLQSDKGKSTYGTQFDQMVVEVTALVMRVI
jgi:hypothetical protein